jgi:broad specificity phosphatase PhoE
MKIYIIRHGETLCNRKGIIQGHKDVPLSEEGIRQAQDASVFYFNEIIKNRLNILAVYSSDLIRAGRTAEIFIDRLKSEGMEVSIFYKKELRETYLGEWEGKSYSQLENDTMTDGMSLFRKWMKEPFETVIPGMESMRDFLERSISAVSQIASHHLKQITSEKDTLFIFTHGGVVRMIQNYAMGRKPGNFVWTGTPNLSGIILQVKDKSLTDSTFSADNIERWETVIPPEK